MRSPSMMARDLVRMQLVVGGGGHSCSCKYLPISWSVRKPHKLISLTFDLSWILLWMHIWGEDTFDFPRKS